MIASSSAEAGNRFRIELNAIAGQSRLQFAFVGRANHAGTTPMHLRYDAIAGAAEWIAAVEREANKVPGLVATVGTIEVKPGATNVIAGEARLTLDARHGLDEVRIRAVEGLIREAQEIAKRRGLSVSQKVLLSQSAVAMDPVLIHEGCVECSDLPANIAGRGRRGLGCVVQDETKMCVNPVCDVRPAGRHRLIGRDDGAREIAAIRVLKEIVPRLGRVVECAKVEAERRIMGICGSSAIGCRDHKHNQSEYAGQCHRRSPAG